MGNKNGLKAREKRHSGMKIKSREKRQKKVIMIPPKNGDETKRNSLWRMGSGIIKGENEKSSQDTDRKKNG